VRVVQRTIIRADQELDIRPLYVGGLSSIGTQEEESRQSGADGWDDEKSGEATIASGVSGAEGIGGFGRVTDDSTVVASPDKRMTLGTYFNAFPAGYWRRWTTVGEVTLRAEVRGHGSLLVYRSTAKGHQQREVSVDIDSGDDWKTVEFQLTLKPFIDGGWYWVDLEGGDTEAELRSAEWLVDTDREQPGSISIGITTFNRPDFCVDQLIELGKATEVLEVIDDIIVVDQGTQNVVDYKLYEQAKAALGDKLTVIEQGNLGGSGGFSRAMKETVERGKSDYCLLLDDDVVCETEGILRGLAFADLAKHPTVVGGQMFSLYDRSVLHAYGETVKPYTWFWGPAPKTKHGHNFASRPLRSTKWLHQRIDVDYNGWWMCMIPTSIIRELGLALPMFIKWDDAEFGLRAKQAGYPTVTLPGMAVWHVPWHEKDDTIDWQAYFHRRNRIVAALLHSPYERGGRLIRESFETQIRHLLSMQYAPAEMGLLAIEDILEGPHRMHRDVLERLPELRELRKAYPDSQMQPSLDAYPPARRKKPPRKGKDPLAPSNKLAKMKTLAVGALHQFKPVKTTALKNPEANVPHLDQKWWLLSQFDSAVVSAADGSAAAWYQRNPEQFRDLLKRSIAIHTRLWKEWDDVAEAYRESLPDLVSPETWQKTFDQSATPPA
jgi:galactofuranosylgalactofuranosylrhamnosyl-N-acetylglucosaminyl-diphospho-decaprenol beta-1,5/1,6-galactofuranosyltransferase